MAVSIVPALIDALFAQATATLPDVTVYDGYGVSDDAGDYLMIGVDDPDSLSRAPSMSQTQTMATAGTPRSRTETGTIPNVIYCWNGDGPTGQKAARDAAYAVAETVAGLLRADPTLGVSSGYQVVVCQVTDITLDQNQDSNGADALITLTIGFEARI